MHFEAIFRLETIYTILKWKICGTRFVPAF